MAKEQSLRADIHNDETDEHFMLVVYRDREAGKKKWSWHVDGAAGDGGAKEGKASTFIRAVAAAEKAFSTTLRNYFWES